jgi:nitrite reductase (NADH) small subunit
VSDHVVAPAASIGPGERVVAQIAGREVAVFDLGDGYVAYLNWCAHQGGPCAEGALTGTYETGSDPESGAPSVEWGREGEILNCPWHGWEYDVETGECLSRPDVALPSYPVRVENGDLVVSL